MQCERQNPAPLPRSIVDACLTVLTPEQIARKFVQGMTFRLMGADGLPLEDSAMKGSVRIARAVRVSCPIPDCPGIAGYAALQQNELLSIRYEDEVFIAPRSYVQAERGEFDLGSRAKQRAARGLRPHVARRQPVKRDVLAERVSDGSNQCRLYPIEAGSAEILVRCPGCPAYANRWIRVDMTKVLPALVADNVPHR